MTIYNYWSNSNKRFWKICVVCKYCVLALLSQEGSFRPIWPNINQHSSGSVYSLTQAYLSPRQCDRFHSVINDQSLNRMRTDLSNQMYQFQKVKSSGVKPHLKDVVFNFFKTKLGLSWSVIMKRTVLHYNINSSRNFRFKLLCAQ